MAANATASATVDAAEKVEINDISGKFTSIMEKIHTMNNMLKEVGLQLKTLQKEVAKVERESSKKSKGGKKSASAGEAKAKRPASGFAKPSAISADLAKFLGLAADTKMPRTEVTRLLNKYIKDNSLQDAKDRRVINPNDALKAILKTDGKDLTYFNLQSAIKHHFVAAA